MGRTARSLGATIDIESFVSTGGEVLRAKVGNAVAIATTSCPWIISFSLGH